jgi:hypothetical protein
MGDRKEPTPPPPRASYEVVSSGSGQSPSPVISLRDYFAAKAMQGLMVSADCSKPNGLPREIAEWAYEQADAMLKARNA